MTDSITVPQPRKRDTLLQKARESLQIIAEKAGQTAAYPGDWLYETWTGGCSLTMINTSHS